MEESCIQAREFCLKSQCISYFFHSSVHIIIHVCIKTTLKTDLLLALRHKSALVQVYVELERERKGDQA